MPRCDAILNIHEVAYNDSQMKPSRKILVMDDEPAILDLVHDMLQEAGYLVKQTQNGEEAIQSYHMALESQEPFAAVILDLINRSGMGGKDTVKRLLEIDPSVKAIAISGFCSEPIMDNYKQYGFKGAVSKPFQSTELIQMLDRVLG